MDGDPTSSPRGSRFNLAADVLHVFVLSSFAFAQPIYDLLGSNAAYFVARGSKPVDLIVLVSVLSLVLPALLAGCLVLARALGAACHTVAFTLLQIALVAGIVLPAAKKLGGLGVAMLVPVGVGILFAVAYRKLRAIPLLLTLVSPAILIFPLVFVFLTPASKIAFPKETPSEAATFSLPPESHVVYLIFDLLPVTALMDENQDLDAERYPDFARMQAQSTWFRRAQTVSAATANAVPALMSGLYPPEGSLGLLEYYPQNLFTLFGTAGDIHAFEPMTRLCPEALCGETRSLSLRSRLASLWKDTSIVFLHLLLPERLTSGLPPIDTQWGSFDQTRDENTDATGEPESERVRRRRLKKGLNKLADNLSSQDRLRKFEIFLDGLGSPAGRNLSFLHLDLPHGPFSYLSSGKKYIPEGRKYRRLRLHAALGKGGGKPGSRTWGPNPHLVDLAYQRLTHQIMLADKLVGQLLDRLEDLGQLERSLIIITADHGQNYEPGWFQRSMADADTLHVPLFIKLPGQREGFVDDRIVESVDILPTLVDALEVNLDWKFDGYSLIPGSEDEPAIEQRPPPELERDLQTRLSQKLDRVASGSPGVLGVGPHRQLVGQRVVDVLKTARSDQEISPFHGVMLDQEALLRDVDPGSDFTPAYLTGSVELGNESPPLELAIALNGVIQATLMTHQVRRETARFAAMVPESSFVAGNNTWAVFRLPDADRTVIAADILAPEDASNLSPEELPLFADSFESGDTSAWQ